VRIALLVLLALLMMLTLAGIGLQVWQLVH
jgi:predicted small lipoprotein YifL